MDIEHIKQQADLLQKLQRVAGRKRPYQADAARKLGVTVGAIKAWVRGDYSPHKSKLLLIDELLKKEGANHE